jgi:hypothetical protein
VRGHQLDYKGLEVGQDLDLGKRFGFYWIHLRPLAVCAPAKKTDDYNLSAEAARRREGRITPTSGYRGLALAIKLSGMPPLLDNPLMRLVSAGGISQGS